MAIINFDFGTPGQPRKCYGDPLGIREYHAYLQEWPENAVWHSELQTRNAGANMTADSGRVLVTWETHIGLCLQDRERNGYDDSDFLMLVWNPEENKPEEICFASTRGWSYPAYGSYADATPETIAAYNAYRANQAEISRRIERKSRAKQVCEYRAIEKQAAVKAGCSTVKMRKLAKAYGRKHAAVIFNLIVSTRIRNKWKLSIAAQVISWAIDPAPKYPLPLSKRQSNALFGIY